MLDSNGRDQRVSVEPRRGVFRERAFGVVDAAEAFPKIANIEGRPINTRVEVYLLGTIFCSLGVAVGSKLLNDVTPILNGPARSPAATPKTPYSCAEPGPVPDPTRFHNMCGERVSSSPPEL
jgi:hypothetical protein